MRNRRISRSEGVQAGQRKEKSRWFKVRGGTSLASLKGEKGQEERDVRSERRPYTAREGGELEKDYLVFLKGRSRCVQGKEGDSTY